MKERKRQRGFGFKVLRGLVRLPNGSSTGHDITTSGWAAVVAFRLKTVGHRDKLIKAY
jgi:hypothetical protein